MLERGLYNERGEEVIADVPDALPPLPQDAEANRLGLAKWLMSPEHPLAARVAVNRLWQSLFGIGLVKTAEDFGVQAEYPPQREVLDWLAVEFVESGWDVKHLIRTIVTSETYRRDSNILNADDFEQDPENRLLARGARYRMPAWMLRDQALAVSGLLNDEIGGQPVFPYQPEGVWAEATFGKKKYTASKGDDLYRRSLYTFWRRIIGPTMFFDSAKRQVCEVKPLRTNTPLHALTTLNDVTYVEASRALACLLLEEDAAPEERLDRLFRRVLMRTPSDQERSVLLASLQRALDHYEADPEEADEFLAHGQHEPPSERSPVQLAAWSAVCLNVLNLDETLTRE